MGDLIQGFFGGAESMELTKKQFAAHPQVRRSTRWVEQQISEGLPSRMVGNRRMVPLQRGLDWLEEHERGAA